MALTWARHPRLTTSQQTRLSPPLVPGALPKLSPGAIHSPSTTPLYLFDPHHPQAHLAKAPCSPQSSAHPLTCLWPEALRESSLHAQPGRPTAWQPHHTPGQQPAGLGTVQACRYSHLVPTRLPTPAARSPPHRSTLWPWRESSGSPMYLFMPLDLPSPRLKRLTPFSLLPTPRQLKHQVAVVSCLS